MTGNGSGAWTTDSEQIYDNNTVGDSDPTGPGSPEETAAGDEAGSGSAGEPGAGEAAAGDGAAGDAAGEAAAGETAAAETAAGEAAAGEAGFAAPELLMAQAGFTFVAAAAYLGIENVRLDYVNQALAGEAAPQQGNWESTIAYWHAEMRRWAHDFIDAKILPQLKSAGPMAASKCQGAFDNFAMRLGNVAGAVAANAIANGGRAGSGGNEMVAKLLRA